MQNDEPASAGKMNIWRIHTTRCILFLSTRLMLRTNEIENASSSGGLGVAETVCGWAWIVVHLLMILCGREVVHDMSSDTDRVRIKQLTLLSLLDAVCERIPHWYEETRTKVSRSRRTLCHDFP